MCTSWPVTPSSCLTSASLWPPRAPRAWPWPPHPAPPTAAPQTEPTPLNWLNHLKEWVGAVSPRPNSIPPCHEEPKRKKSDDGKGWVRSHGRVWKGDPRHPSSLSCPPTQAYLSSSLSLKRVTLFWGSKPWTTYTAGGEVWHRVGEKWGSVFGIFFSA